MPKKKSGPNKSDFVRSQPSTLSASEVVAKGKEAGMTFSPALVYVIRAKQHGKMAKAKGSKAKKSAPAKAAPAVAVEGKPSEKATPTAKKSGPSKSDFVRSLPVELSVAEVVAKAKEAGIAIASGYVSNIRSAAKKGDSKAKKSATKAAKAHAATVAADEKKHEMAEKKKTDEKPSGPAKLAGNKPSASDFIRSLPLTMSVKEVAEKAATAGYSFKPAYVYDVRNADKKRKAKAAKALRSESKAKATAVAAVTPKAAVKPSSAPKSVAAHAGHSSSQRAQFRKLMIDLGLTQAEALYADVLHELKEIRDRD